MKFTRPIIISDIVFHHLTIFTRSLVNDFLEIKNPINNVTLNEENEDLEAFNNSGNSGNTSNGTGAFKTVRE